MLLGSNDLNKLLIHIFVLQILRKIFSLINTENVLEKIAIEHNAMDLYSVMYPA